LTCDKLDVKGLDIVRSSFPPAMRDLMTGVLKDILGSSEKDVIDSKIIDFKSEMKKMPIHDVALPTGVKNIKKYTDKNKRGKFNSKNSFTNIKKGAPVHVKAAIKYNDLLKHFNLNNYEEIRGSEKIKWLYLKNNEFGIESIAFKGYDDPDKIMNFITKYVDYEKLYKGALEKKIRMFYEALKWDMPVDEKNTLERFF